jgi:hypothetical protein
MTDPWIGSDEGIDLDEIMQTAQALVNPLGVQTSLTEASLGDLDLRQEGESLSLMQDDTLLLTAVNGQVEAPEAVSPQAAEALQGWVKEHVWVWREVPIEEAIPAGDVDAKSMPEKAPRIEVNSTVTASLRQADLSGASSQMSQQETPAAEHNPLKPSKSFRCSLRRWPRDLPGSFFNG